MDSIEGGGSITIKESGSPTAWGQRQRAFDIAFQHQGRLLDAAITAWSEDLDRKGLFGCPVYQFQDDVVDCDICIINCKIEETRYACCLLWLERKIQIEEER